MPTTKMWATSAWWPALLLSLLVLAPAGAPAEEARNRRLVGTDDLQARSAYQPIVHHQRIGKHQRPLAAGTPRVAPVPVT